MSPLEQLRKVITDEGAAPHWHRVVMGRHRREWPMLWAAIDRLLAETPGLESVPRDLDLPFEKSAPGTTVSLEDAAIANGWIVMAGTIPVPDVGLMGCLFFRFTSPEGEFYKPVALIMPDDQLLKSVPLITQVVGAVMRALGRG